MANPYINNTQDMLKYYGGFPGMEKNQLKLERTLGQGLYPRVAAQIGFGNSLEPQRQQSILDLAKTLSPGNAQASLNRYASNVRGQSALNARNQELASRSAGYGSGISGGMGAGAINQGQELINQAYQNLYSPQGQAQLQSLVVNALNSGQKIENLDDLIALLTGGVNQQTAQSQQQGGDPLSTILGIGGSLAGAGAFNSLFDQL